ncbi:MAG: hypothetical protein KDA91_07925 [Planctomycetaceae bacterium]|nr:hypothetical protein [Planctomycetaceae bacterium]
MDRTTHPGKFLSRLQWLQLTAAMLLLFCISGCALGVMAGKMLMGDPKQTAVFHAATGTDLTKSQERVLIICSAPHGILNRFPSLEIDLVDRISRILETRGVQVVSSDQVAAWYDDHGEWGDFSELADSFDAHYVMNIELRTFSYQVPESDHLMQGSANGLVVFHEVTGEELRPSYEVLRQNFQLRFPETYPVPRENRSEQIFAEGFMDRTAIHLAQMLYDHKSSETVH